MSELTLYTLDDLTNGIKSSDDDELKDEFIWRIGSDERVFNEYFKMNENNKYIIQDEELKSVFPDEYTLEDLGCRFGEISIRNVIKTGYLRLLKRLISNNYIINDSQICMYAALYGNLEILEYLYESGFYMNRWVYAAASFNGHKNILEWLLMKEGDNIKWDALSCAFAARNGHFELLKWLRDNKCPLDYTVLLNAKEFAHKEIYDWTLSCLY